MSFGVLFKIIGQIKLPGKKKVLAKLNTKTLKMFFEPIMQYFIYRFFFREMYKSISMKLSSLWSSTLQVYSLHSSM